MLRYEHLFGYFSSGFNHIWVDDEAREDMVVITEKAGAKIKTLLAGETTAYEGLRVYVSGGGCQGVQYGMTFEERANPDDTIIEAHGVKVFIDSESAPMLDGAEVDYVDSREGAGFAIKNPQAKSSCGCGNSSGA